MTYDSREDILQHKQSVRDLLTWCASELEVRADTHDASKLLEPEKSAYDHCVPRLKAAEYGSEEYIAAAKDLGDGLKHHFANNRHHPEHFANGIAGMTLIDLIEMVCDWRAAARARSRGSGVVNLQINAERFNINPQLVQIISNTLELLNEVG